MARKKGSGYCSICRAKGADSVTCGYCKAKTGHRCEHILCNECFLKGCPVMLEEQKAKKENDKFY